MKKKKGWKDGTCQTAIVHQAFLWTSRRKEGHGRQKNRKVKSDWTREPGVVKLVSSTPDRRREGRMRRLELFKENFHSIVTDLAPLAAKRDAHVHNPAKSPLQNQDPTPVLSSPTHTEHKRWEQRVPVRWHSKAGALHTTSGRSEHSLVGVEFKSRVPA